MPPLLHSEVVVRIYDGEHGSCLCLDPTSEAKGKKKGIFDRGSLTHERWFDFRPWCYDTLTREQQMDRRMAKSRRYISRRCYYTDYRM